MNITINGRTIGSGLPSYIVAEMSANHNQQFDQAVKILEAAKDAGANAIKLQTYTPDTITIDCDKKYFRINGTIWEGKTLHQLYSEAFTPWAWQPKLKELADSVGIDLFSTPFDVTAVDFLEEMGVPAYKIGSFEIVDIPLIKRIARTGKPMIISTGMATLGEIDEAVQAARSEGAMQIALLKCTSAYPAPLDEANLRTIPHLAEAFHVPVGISDHTLETAIPLAAVTLGACIVEKHFTLSRSVPGPDTAFSLEPNEFKYMVESIRSIEKAFGEIRYAAHGEEAKSLNFRRSLFAVEDMKKGELFTEENVRSIRPAHGLHPRFLPEIYGLRAATEIKRGTPLNWSLISRD